MIISSLTDFQNWTISEAKNLFEQGLSDTQNLDQCKSAINEEMIIPEEYDWRKEHPNCLRE